MTAAKGREDGGALAVADLRARFERAVGRIVPRLLTQVNRDSSSPSFGSFDRNWWHYKIRDFSSIILQQGAYALGEVIKLKCFDGDRASLAHLARGGARFWNERACRRGAFEEYYPWEQGYPPLAFSTLAIAKLANDGLAEPGDIHHGVRAAVKQLERRFESRAGNQQVAGLAAVGVMKEVFPGLIEERSFDRLTARTLELQHEEGWFVEYDGPDLGYLAVTIDCLWDLFDATGQERFLESARRALRFLAGLTAVHGTSVGMLNARNTDYVVPYGIVRLALGEGEEADLARGVAALLYTRLDAHDHFLAAIDDRYLSHYIGHSFIRALRLLEGAPDGDWGDEALRGFPPAKLSDLPGCGYAIHKDEAGRGFLGALKKGGVFTWSAGERRASDFGWQVREGDRIFFNHWWSPDWEAEVRDGEMEVSGKLFSHRAASSGPFKHFVLRVLSFSLGSRIIGWLKSKLIFKEERSSIDFRRTIRTGVEEVLVEDRFDGLPAGSEVVRAPRASKRHVSSADSFHPEDLALCRDVTRTEERQQDGGRLTILTRYTLVSES